MIKHLKIAALSVALPLAAISSAHAGISMNFNLPDISSGGAYEEILNYYNGGADQYGAIGPNYGVIWGPDSLALLNSPYSNVGNEPGGGNSAIFLSGTGDVMNVPGGFNTGFSFYYAAPYYGGSVTVYSGQNGTGTLLGTLDLSVNGVGPGPGQYSNWSAIGVSFAGTAESAIFSGTANYIAFTDVTIGSANPGSGNSNGVPDNTGWSIYLMAGLGLAGVARASRKQGIATV
jgi:hypothetical protein